MRRYMIIAISVLLVLSVGCGCAPNIGPDSQNRAQPLESPTSANTQVSENTRLLIEQPAGLGEGMVVGNDSIFWDIDNETQIYGLREIYRSIPRIQPLPDDILTKTANAQEYTDVSKYFINWLAANAQISDDAIKSELSVYGIWSFVKSVEDKGATYRYISISLKERDPFISFFPYTYAYLQVSDGTDSRIYILYEGASFWVGDVILSVGDEFQILLVGDWAGYKACSIAILGFSLTEADVIVQIPYESMLITTQVDDEYIVAYSDALMIACNIIVDPPGIYTIWQSHTWTVEGQDILVYNDQGQHVLSVST